MVLDYIKNIKYSEKGWMTKMSIHESRKGLKFRPTILVDCFKDQQGEELIDEAHMEGLVMQKCSGRDIYCSNSFMVATKRKSSVITEKYYRIQDKVFFHAFATICRNKCFCTEEKCKINDATAAECIMEHEIGKLKEYGDVEKIQKIEVVHDTNQNREGMHYICPLTKLDEIAFPVRLYDRQMGVLIVGQVSTKENREELEKCIKDKLKGFAEAGKTEEQTIKEAIEKIKEVDNKILQELIDKIAGTVDDIEKGLIECYKERQNQYVFEKSSELIEDFKKDIEGNGRNTVDSSELVYPASEHMEYYNFVGECIKKQLKALCNTIGVLRSKIFIPDFDNLANNRYDKIKGESGLTFSFDQWSIKKHEIVCDDLREYIDGIESEFDLLLVAAASTYPIALAVCSKEFLYDVTEEEKLLLQWTFSEVFNKFAEYSQMAGMEAKSDYYRAYLDSYMSIQRHELGQSNLGYQMLIEGLKKQRNKFGKEIYESGLDLKTNDLVKEYIKHNDSFICDSEAYLHTTMIRIQSTKYLIDFSNVQKRYFYPYDAFLFKWKHIYGMKAKEEYLQFYFPNVNSSDHDRPTMYGDPLMIEQAAYNLTNNAIKYAICGTAVSLDCRLNKKCNRYEIIVENLGVPFKNEAEKKTIFQFGRRGSNNEKEGSGLGLFLTKQVAKAHDGDVICEIEKLSQYNWGLIQLYIKYYHDKNVRNLCKNKELCRHLERELKEKEEEISKYAVGNIPDNAFTPMYVNQNILKGTAKFRFTFWIPYKR